MLAGCHCKLRGKESAVFSISYIGNQLAISYNLAGGDNWQLCFYLHDVILPTGIYVSELFGLGRFAMDHSLTKPASRPLFVHVRRCAPQRNF